MTGLAAVDLDRTLIYSRGAVEAWGSGGADLVAVERYEHADASWMTVDAAVALAQLTHRATVVPVTTRTPRQLRRIQLPGTASRYSVAANGGVLLVDDEPDSAWQAHIARQLTGVASLSEIWTHAAQVCHPDWTRSLRNADDLFCYAVLERDRVPVGFVAEAESWADSRGWRLSLQGRKLYWVPSPLTKSAAAGEVARRTGADVRLAAGDSLLDTDLLDWADRGIAARHGELVAKGWTAPHVQVTEANGVLAGAEIVTWLTSQL